VRPVLRRSPFFPRQNQREANGYKKAGKNGYENGDRCMSVSYEELTPSKL
jgi:hypothetical protein